MSPPVSDPAFWPALRVLFDRLSPLTAPQREEVLAASDAPSALIRELRSLLAHADLVQTHSSADHDADADTGATTSVSAGAAAAAAAGAAADAAADTAADTAADASPGAATANPSPAGIAGRRPAAGPHAGFLAQPAAAASPGLGADLFTGLGADLLTGLGADLLSGLGAAPQASQCAALHTGQRLGPWLIDGLLGRGGMGEVWAAHRADGAYSGRAAIKVLRLGLDSRRVLARFAQEQQALARLNHRHIAHLLDAGRTDGGRPYFVMQAVDGMPIDQACAARTLEQRLALFLQLADAVSHAHRQLLVHRDLKPGNVLVTADGEVKLLDFGIAKAIDPLDDHDGITTVAGERPFTRHFASPEQVRGEPVGTATDIYSLGGLLYVMLTGLRPYGRGATSAQEAARSVLNDEPTRPSALSPGLVADPQWPRTRRRLQGDLDYIVLKALDKCIDARYPSVDAFAADIRAFLGGYPVSARPAGWALRSAKFVARHRLSVALATLGGLALVGALAMSLWQMQRADLARGVAERRFAQVRQLANGMVFRHPDQIAQLPGAIASRDALLQDAVRYLDGLLAEGAPDAALAQAVAQTCWRIAVLLGEQFSPSLERLADARRNLDKALALLPRDIDRPDADVSALVQAADFYPARTSQSVRSAQLQQVQQALEGARKPVVRALALQPDNLETISRLASLEGRIGRALGGSPARANLGPVDEALLPLQQSVRNFERPRQRDSDNAEWARQLAWGCHNMARLLMLAGQPAQARLWAERTLALREEAARRQPGHAQ